MPTYDKDPDEVLDYSVDWSSWLANDDTIVTAEWDVPAGLAVPKTVPDDGKIVTVWLEGGTVGETYPVTSRVVTGVGRTGERTFYIRVAQK